MLYTCVTVVIIILCCQNTTFILHYLYRIMVEDFKKFCSILSCSNCTIINNIFLQAIYHILRYKHTVSGLEQHGSFIRKRPLKAHKFLTQNTCTWYSHQLWALSINNKNSGLKFQKFHMQNGTVAYKSWIQKLHIFPSHRRDLSQCTFGYCSCMQDTKEWYWGHQLCQMKRDISVRPSDMTRPVKVDRL